jgi:hypothetical protein
VDTWDLATNDDDDDDDDDNYDDDNDDYIANVGSSEYAFCTEFFKTPPIV